MALVPDYGSDSGSGGEEEKDVEVQNPVVTATLPQRTSTFSVGGGILDVDDLACLPTSSSAFARALPKPKTPVTSTLSKVEKRGEEIGPIPPKKVYGDEEQPLKPPPKKIPLYHPNISAKKVQGVVRIAAPNLKDFVDDDDGEAKMKTRGSSKGGSGLFSILPKPKGDDDDVGTATIFSKPNASASSTTATPSGSGQRGTTPSSSSAGGVTSRSSFTKFVPDSVKNLGKRPTNSKLEEIKAKYLKKEMNVEIVSTSSKKKEKGKTRNSDSEEEEGSSNFFSFTSGLEEVDDETLEKLKLPMPSEPTPSASTYQDYSDEDEEEIDTASTSPIPRPSEDLLKYLPKMKSRGGQPINFIDIKAADLKQNETELVKNMTDESAVPTRRAKGLGGMQKRKHQITYLAVEAKAREQELQAQWATGRENRRAGRMKYGF